MPVFKSKIISGSDSFQQNRAEMLELIGQLKELNQRGALISGKRAQRFAERGQLTPRERLAQLLDPGMPWLAIGNLAGYLLDTKDPEKSLPGSTIISGIGFIAGVRCVVVVDDSGIMAGSLTEAGGYRIMRSQEIAFEQKLPFVHLAESAGGDLLNYKVQGFTEGGTLFGNQAKLSKAGIPVISILHGSSTAGGAYMPGLSDYVIAVKGRGRAFLAGPPLLKAATGEIATEEELGGAEMHATTSGLAEYLAENDGHGISLARELMQRLQWNANCSAQAPSGFREPIYDPDEIAGVIPVDYRTPYDMRELVARIVDGSEFLDFKARYGVSTVCLQAEIFGQACGILGNNGPIDPQGATKAAQFMQLCEQANLPVIFLQNTTGYIVGTKSEQAGMIKHGSKMVQAVQNLEVP
ncbi:MAG: acyl-CoA carboxylase subunit beta, partial [Gammaproteobacteria bacterium]|nr:acyl-CoA carboxylase subunit beta [Gammaproteobacteria bacterium]